MIYSWKNYLFIGIIIVALLGFIFQIIELFNLPLIANFYDFKVYYFASSLTKGGENPYQTSLIKDALTAYGQPLMATRFLYPMTFALFFIPFTFFTLESAAQIWLIINICFIALCFYFCNIIVKNKNHLCWIAVSLVLMAFFNPLYYTLKLGQINVVILFLLLLSLFFITKQPEKKIYSLFIGVALGVATLIKIFPVIILFYLFIKKKYKIVIIAVVTIIFLTTISGLIVGFDQEIQYYFKKLPAVFSSVPVAPISIPGFIKTAFSKDTTAAQLFSLSRKKIDLLSDILTALLAIATFLYVWLLKNKSKLSTILEFSLMIVLTLLISGSVHRHYIIWCLPIIFFCFYYACQKKHFVLLTMVIISYFLLNAVATNLTALEKIKYIGSLLIAPNFWGLGILFMTLIYFLWREHCCTKS